MAACLAAELDGDDMIDVMKNAAMKMNGKEFGWKGVAGKVGEVLKNSLEEVLPPDVENRVNGKLFVSLTSMSPRPFSSLIVDTFESKDDLISALLTSCHIPGYTFSETTVPFRGIRCFDGGFSVNTPLLNNETFLISPFPPLPWLMPPYDVCLVESIPLQNLIHVAIIPDDSILQDLYDEGFDKGKTFAETLNRKDQPKWVKAKFSKKIFN